MPDPPDTRGLLADGSRLVVRRDAGVAPEGGDGAALLSGALAGLASTTGAERLGGWWCDSHGGWSEVSGSTVPVTADDPDVGVFVAGLNRAGRAVDLAGESVDARVSEFARRIGVSAGIAVTSRAGLPLAALLLEGLNDPAGAVRPRTLAALASTAERLRDPLATAQAIERLERLDADARDLDRVAALGDLLSEVVHEVRNPLVSVKTFLQLLPDRLNDPEFLGSFRDVVTEEVARLERLLDDVLHHARPERQIGEGPAGAGRCDVRPAIESVTRLLGYRANERRVRIVAQVDPSLGEIRIREDALRQILLNLTLNALAASPPGGRVTLTADPAGREARVCVEDEGPGMPDEVRARLFEPFFTTRAKGPGGLGLAIAHRLGEEAGGALTVEDGSVRGARLCLRVPLA